MQIKIEIDENLYTELKQHAKSENQFIMGFCNKLFTEKVKEILNQNSKKKVQ